MELSWREPLEGESPKSWAAFQIYRDKPPVGVDSRSLVKLADELGYKSPSTIEQYSYKFHWVERAAKYDRYMAERQLTLRETGLDEYRNTIIQSESEVVATAGSLIIASLTALREKQLAGEDVPAIEIKRLTSALIDVSNVSRRAAGMATSFTRERVEDEIDEETTFVVSART